MPISSGRFCGMAKRDIVREGAILDLIEYKGFHRAPTEYIIDRVFNYLHSQGVVIKKYQPVEPSDLWFVESLVKEEHPIVTQLKSGFSGIIQSV